ncbi:hypothetical protein M2347_004084 [Chryseobacterium sp. H1D6B]|uniref:type VI secretion system amidase effector protein Tae4 n=1 Tax=Chryseobacterium sp. H1D6B TaxID=2940588 RepID=UPI0015CD845A|nr:type VI secretion system amidase effector protein Tae4 [Chryseobacterium sp. H1D6B]MDH6254357.1 hypothetical protein [Chryseobacterium sp. H1D6B]
MVRFDELWKNHPGTYKPCNENLFQNQCAVRMSQALYNSNVDMLSFHGIKCWEKHNDGFKHALRAQELADWLHMHPEIFGNRLKLERKKYPKMNYKSFKHKGIIFIKNGWGPTDHIDLWDGVSLKGGTADYFNYGAEIWFWALI